MEEKKPTGESPEQQPEKKRKIPWSWIYIGATVLAVVLFGILNDEFHNVFATISGLIPVYILVAVAILLLYYIFESEIMRLLMRSQGIKLSPLKSFKIGFIGSYYSAITPSATGGQPMQSAYLYRDNVPVGSSAAVLVIKFFCYQCAFEICALASFFFMYSHLASANPKMIPLIIAGLIINGGSVIFFPSLFFKPVLRNVCRFAKWLVGKFRFLKKRNPDKAIDKFEADFGSYTDDFRNKTKSIVLAILLSVPQFILQMSVIYFIFLSFGYQHVNYFEILAIQCILQVSVSFMPMPGASGAQEIGFAALFRPYFTNNDLFTGVMVWRFFTYYLVVIIGAALVIVDQVLYRRKRAREEKKRQD